MLTMFESFQLVSDIVSGKVGMDSINQTDPSSESFSLHCWVHTEHVQDAPDVCVFRVKVKRTLMCFDSQFLFELHQGGVC